MGRNDRFRFWWPLLPKPDPEYHQRHHGLELALPVLHRLERAVTDPLVQHAVCEDYRPGLGVDRAADDADRTAGRQITNPFLVLWGESEEVPDQLTDTLVSFLPPT